MMSLNIVLKGTSVTWESKSHLSRWPEHLLWGYLDACKCTQALKEPS